MNPSNFDCIRRAKDFYRTEYFKLEVGGRAPRRTLHYFDALLMFCEGESFKSIAERFQVVEKTIKVQIRYHHYKVQQFLILERKNKC